MAKFRQKMQAQGLQTQNPQHKLRYADLALLLKQAFGQLDKTFCATGSTASHPIRMVDNPFC